MTASQAAAAFPWSALMAKAGLRGTTDAAPASRADTDPDGRTRTHAKAVSCRPAIPPGSTAASAVEAAEEGGSMRHQRHKAIRDMQVVTKRTHNAATIEIDVVHGDYGGGPTIYVNGDPCESEATAARLMIECLESLVHARSHSGGQWIKPDGTRQIPEEAAS